MGQIFIVSPNPNYPLLAHKHTLKITELNFKTLAGKRGSIDQNIADQRQTAGMRKLSLCISLTLEGEKPISQAYFEPLNFRCKSKAREEAFGV